MVEPFIDIQPGTTESSPCWNHQRTCSHWLHFHLSHFPSTTLMMSSTITTMMLLLVPLCLHFARIDAFSHPVRNRVTSRELTWLSARNDESGANNDGTKNNKRRATTWGALNSKPYVPSGMTAAEYAAIKKREADEQKKLNFGAFGPRFSRQSRPSGDWMLQKSLWTRGFDSNAPAVNGSGGVGSANDSREVLLGRLSRNVPVLFVTYLLAVATLTCVRLAQGELGGASGLSLRSAMVRASKVAMTVASLRAESIVRRIAVPIASLLLFRPFSGILDAINRKWLWSKRKSLSVIAASAVLSTYIWAAMLNLIQKIV